MIFLIKITYIYLLLITKGRIFRNTAWVMCDRLKTKFTEKKDWEVFPNLLSKRFYFFHDKNRPLGCSKNWHIRMGHEFPAFNCMTMYYNI